MFAWFLGHCIESITAIQDKQSFALETFKHLLSQQYDRQSTTHIVLNTLSKLKCKFDNDSFTKAVEKLMRGRQTEGFSETNVRIREYLSASDANLWGRVENPDTTFGFLEGFVKKQVFKTGKVYDPGLRAGSGRAVEKRE